MIGVVLSGGRSTRMGLDKGLLELNGKKWVDISREKLDPLLIPTIISVNQQQLVSYSKYFSREVLIADNPNISIQGPLLGLLSVHLIHPDEDIFLLACDMINIETVVLKKMLDEFREHRSEAMVFKGENIEPLCAIYSSGGLKKIMSNYNDVALTNFSLMHVLEKLSAVYLPIKPEWRSFFKNFNQPSDL